MAKLLALLTAAGVLVGCAPLVSPNVDAGANTGADADKAKTQAAQVAAPAPAPTSHPEQVLEVLELLYHCDSGQRIAAHYPDTERVHLLYQGQRYTLVIAISASGARYVGQGLQWWTKGQEGSLFALADAANAADAAANADSAPALEQCRIPSNAMEHSQDDDE